MQQKEIKRVNYLSGEEAKILQLLYQSDKPIILQVSDLKDFFNLDYFIKSHENDSTFYRYAEGKIIEHAQDKFSTIIKKIKDNQAIRIFGELVSPELDKEVQDKIGLWKSIPFRPRYYQSILGKPMYFFGGKGANTSIHYDREFNSNLHLCLYGQKRVLLFTVDDSQNLYKVPYISDSLIDFSNSLPDCEEQYPLLGNATCYEAVLNPGDMLYMPKCCWHYIEYLEPNASVTFAFYPKKVDQFLGMLNGLFYLGFSKQTLSFNQTALYKFFALHFAKSSGFKRLLMKGVEAISYTLLYPFCVLAFFIRLKVKGGKLY